MTIRIKELVSLKKSKKVSSEKSDSDKVLNGVKVIKKETLNIATVLDCQIL